MRCQWCGNPNPIGTTICGSCGKDLVKDQTIRESVEVLQSIQLPDGEIVCPKCGVSNLLSSEFCDLCRAPLHSRAVWPKTPEPTVRPPDIGPVLWTAILGTAALLVVGLIGGAAFGISLLDRPRQMPSQTVTVPTPSQLAQGDDALPDVPGRIDVDGKESGAMAKAKIAEANPKAPKKRVAPKSTSSYPRIPVFDPNKPNNVNLKLPVGSVRIRNSYVKDGTTIVGTQSFSVPAAVWECQEHFSSIDFWRSAMMQGLHFSGGSYSYPTGQTKREMGGASAYYRVEGRKDCHIDIRMSRLRTTAPVHSEVVVDYVLPSAWTLSFGS